MLIIHGTFTMIHLHNKVLHTIINVYNKHYKRIDVIRKYMTTYPLLGLTEPER